MKVVRNGIGSLRDEINQVRFHGCLSLRNRYQQRLGRNITGIQHSLLVVEQNLDDRSQVITHYTDRLIHVRLVNQEVFVGVADIVDDGFTTGEAETIGIIYPLAGSKAHHKNRQRRDAFDNIDLFHCLVH